MASTSSHDRRRHSVDHRVVYQDDEALITNAVLILNLSTETTNHGSDQFQTRDAYERQDVSKASSRREEVAN